MHVGLSILFITHDMAVVSQMADRIAVMKEGEILEQAERKVFFENPEHPYTQALLRDAMAGKEERSKANRQRYPS